MAAQEAAPRVTFDNMKETAPHLYVTKIVESEDERYQAPADAVFNFILKLDGYPVEKMTYRVFNENGQEVYSYDGYESTEDKSGKGAYKTDRYGGFTLKAGQTAKFEYVGAGKAYELREAVQEDFEQIVPAGEAPLVGTVVPEGSTAVFKNLYKPEQESEMTRIVINKGTTFLEGYEVPDAEPFDFTITLNNRAYGLEDYTIINTLTGIKSGEGMTKADGSFSLGIGETAVFENVPTEIDYLITEETTEGWRVAGTTTQEGKTRAPATTINYTNIYAAFGVTKTLADNSSSEEVFTFQLSDGNKKPIAKANYYLYNINGKRTDEIIHYTDEKGKFTLYADQTAIFFGMESGTVYNVSEDGRADYIQKVPLDGEGYTNKTVADTVEMLPFVNEKVPDTKALSITKVVDSSTGEMPMNQDDFHFQLLKKTQDVYEPVAKATYRITVGSNTETGKTDEDGTFTLKRNETARFEGLESGAVYKVKEIDLSEEYEIEVDEQEGTLSEHLIFTFENTYLPKAVDLKIHKKADGNTGLGEAKFDLYADELLVNKINEEELISNGEGLISILDLKPGIYYLVETVSPTGYQLLSGPIKIEIVRDNEGLYVVIENDVYKDTDPQKNIYIVENSKTNDEVHLTVYNSRSFYIPIAGGNGVTILFRTVLLTIAVFSVVLIKKKKKA